jgi:glycosyltransferase involved in cell wall biosynthesis
MKLSIITPTLNAASSIERCIQTVLDQEQSGIEHLVIDGGSTDGTLDTVQHFSGIRLIQGPDEGIFDAINKGVAASSGEWIYFLGADDVFADAAVLNDLAPYFESHLDVFYGDIVDIKMGHRYDGPFDIFKIRKRNICHQAIFFRREVFDTIGLFNDEYRSYADWDHNMRWMLNREIRKQYVDRVIAHYGGEGFSYLYPDPKFKRDRLFRYLTYGKGVLPAWLFWGLLVKELANSLRELSWARFKRAICIPFP